MKRWVDDGSKVSIFFSAYLPGIENHWVSRTEKKLLERVRALIRVMGKSNDKVLI